MADESDPIISTAIAKIKREDFTLKDLVALVARKATALPVPAQVPLPPAITDEQRAALDRLPDVFGRVVPAERRDLQPIEVSMLLIERDTLGTIETMAADRKNAIRTTILNAHDVRIEGEGVPEDIERDKDGHYIRKGEVRAEPDAGQRFSVEARAGSASIDPKVIEALGDDPEVDYCSHEDYLACTRQVRVFDEEAAMIHLRKKPEMIRAIREATIPGRGSVAVQPRKA